MLIVDVPQHWTTEPKSKNHEFFEWGKRYPTLEKAWDLCDRPDWMIWVVADLSSGPSAAYRRRIVGCIAECIAPAIPVFERLYPNWKFGGGNSSPELLRYWFSICERFGRGDEGVSSNDLKASENAAGSASSTASIAATANYSRWRRQKWREYSTAESVARAVAYLAAVATHTGNPRDSAQCAMALGTPRFVELVRDFDTGGRLTSKTEKEMRRHTLMRLISEAFQVNACAVRRHFPNGPEVQLPPVVPPKPKSLHPWDV